MGDALGVIVVLCCGAGVMYLYLQASGRLRRVEYEQELSRKIHELKAVEKAYLDTLEAQRRREEEEEQKWKPKDNLVIDKKQQDLMLKSLSSLLSKYQGEE